MPTNALQDLGDNARAHASEPILVRDSDLFGAVKVYPPAVDPKDWANHSWLLTTEHDADKNPPGMAVRIKASVVTECFERPHFIDERHMFDKST